MSKKESNDSVVSKEMLKDMLHQSLSPISDMLKNLTKEQPYNSTNINEMHKMLCDLSVKIDIILGNYTSIQPVQKKKITRKTTKSENEGKKVNKSLPIKFNLNGDSDEDKESLISEEVPDEARSEVPDEVTNNNEVPNEVTNDNETNDNETNEVSKVAKKSVKKSTVKKTKPVTASRVNKLTLFKESYNNNKDKYNGYMNEIAEQTDNWKELTDAKKLQLLYKYIKDNYTNVLDNLS